MAEAPDKHVMVKEQTTTRFTVAAIRGALMHVVKLRVQTRQREVSGKIGSSEIQQFKRGKLTGLEWGRTRASCSSNSFLGVVYAEKKENG